MTSQPPSKSTAIRRVGLSSPEPNENIALSVFATRERRQALEEEGEFRLLDRIR